MDKLKTILVGLCILGGFILLDELSYRAITATFWPVPSRVECLNQRTIEMEDIHPGESCTNEYHRNVTFEEGLDSKKTDQLWLAHLVAAIPASIVVSIAVTTIGGRVKRRRLKRRSETDHDTQPSKD